MRIRHLLPIVLAIAAGPACKKKSNPFDKAFAAMGAFKDRMCGCKDRACAERVQEDLTRWSQENARTLDDRSKPREAELRQMQEVGTRYGECMAKLYNTTDGPGGALPSPPPPPGEKITNADRLVKVAFDLASGFAVSKLVLSYVRADGTLDPTYGEAQLELGKPKPPDPADDPNRPIGAPVPESPPAYDMTSRCPSYRWKGGVRTDGETSCLMFGAGLARPKCSVVEVWRRAIEKGAPEKALAVLALTGPPMASWTLSIDDSPRNIHFSIDVEDTCAPTLEKPQ